MWQLGTHELLEGFRGLKIETYFEYILSSVEVEIYSKYAVEGVSRGRSKVFAKKSGQASSLVTVCAVKSPNRGINNHMASSHAPGM